MSENDFRGNSDDARTIERQEQTAATILARQEHILAELNRRIQIATRRIYHPRVTVEFDWRQGQALGMSMALMMLERVLRDEPEPVDEGRPVPHHGSGP